MLLKFVVSVVALGVLAIGGYFVVKEDGVRALRKVLRDRLEAGDYLAALATAGKIKEAGKSTEELETTITQTARFLVAEDIYRQAVKASKEERLDILYREIKKYLLQLSQQTLSPEHASQQSDPIILTCDLENIGDAIIKSVLPLAKIKIGKKLFFSEEGFKELREFHTQVVQNFQLTISAFTNQNLDLYKKVLENKEQLLHTELHLRENHLIRLRHGVKEAFDTSSLHIELLSHFGKINSFISNIAYQILHKENGNHKEAASPTRVY